MNGDTTIMNDDINRIKQWIISHLREECNIEEISPELPLVEQLDSFHVVGFLVACDEKFQSLRQSGTDQFSGLSIDEVARHIASKNKSHSIGNS